MTESWHDIAKQIDAIDAQIFDLNRKREELIAQDDDYAYYYAEAGADETLHSRPVSIQEYHKLLDEALAIYAEYEKAPDDKIYELDRKHGRRIHTLERMLYF